VRAADARYIDIGGDNLKVEIYEHLLLINTAYDQVLQSLAALQKHRPFHAAEVARFRRSSKEARASLNSYLTAVIESAETAQAGRLFGRRVAQEHVDELGDPET
jgi:hypothetical protein